MISFSLVHSTDVLFFRLENIGIRMQDWLALALLHSNFTLCNYSTIVRPVILAGLILRHNLVDCDPAVS